MEINMRKPFDKQLYQKNDQPAKDAVRRAFKDIYNYDLKDNEDLYGPDLEAHQNGKFIGYVEVEVKQFWKDHKHFPSNTMHIPERKSRLISLNYKTFPIVLCVLSADLKAGYWIDGESLMKCPTIIKSTIYLDNERFYEIPLIDMTYFDIKEEKKEDKDGDTIKS
jgi:hypothetical protein